MARTSHILPSHRKDMTTRKGDQRLERFGFAPNWVRNEFIAFLGEFGGTFMFLFIAFAATQVANTSSTQANSSNLLYISLAFGFSLGINVWAFFRISGGLFNPAVTLGLFLIGIVKPLRSILIFLAQIIASICAAAVVDGLLPGPLNVNTNLGGDTNIAQGLFIEMFLTAELVFVIFMLAAEKHKATYLAPIGIGIALFVAEMAGVYYTGGSLNPARSFGPSVVTGRFHGYHWIYWLGPALGTALAWGFYSLMKFTEYETANPGQDFNDQETQMFSPPADAVTAGEVQRPNVSANTAEQVIERVLSNDRSRGRPAESVGPVVDSTEK